MDELLRHLGNDHVASLYPDGYTHLTAEIYNVLYFAVRDGAEELYLNENSFVWLKNKQPIKTAKISGKAAAYRAELMRVRETDAIVGKYTRVLRESSDQFAVEFIAG